MDLATLSTGAALVMFGVATVMGIITLRVWPYFRSAIAYMALTAFANFVFRGYTFSMRLTGKPLQQPFATNAAIVLQLALAVALFLGISLSYFRAVALRGGGHGGG